MPARVAPWELWESGADRWRSVGAHAGPCIWANSSIDRTSLPGPVAQRRPLCTWAAIHRGLGVRCRLPPWALCRQRPAGGPLGPGAGSSTPKHPQAPHRQAAQLPGYSTGQATGTWTPQHELRSAGSHQCNRAASARGEKLWVRPSSDDVGGVQHFNPMHPACVCCQVRALPCQPFHVALELQESSRM